MGGWWSVCGGDQAQLGGLLVQLQQQASEARYCHRAAGGGNGQG